MNSLPYHPSARVLAACLAGESGRMAQHPCSEKCCGGHPTGCHRLCAHSQARSLAVLVARSAAGR
eukprot:1297571-Pleurochrysis_carterae.AAC.1